MPNEYAYTFIPEAAHDGQEATYSDPEDSPDPMTPPRRRGAVRILFSPFTKLMVIGFIILMVAVFTDGLTTLWVVVGLFIYARLTHKPVRRHFGRH